MNESVKNKSIVILNNAIVAAGKMSAYPEELSDKGLAELLIFCVDAGLLTEFDEDVISMTLSSLIHFLSNNSGLGLTESDMKEHILERSKYFTKILIGIVKDPETFDLKPIYCAFFRYPLTNVKYAPAEPMIPDLFREIVVRSLTSSSL